MMPGDGARVAASGCRRRYAFRPVPRPVDGLLRKDMAEDRLASSVLAISAYRKIGLLHPVDKPTRLGGNAGRVRLVVESLFGWLIIYFACSIKLDYL
jgi:hypothetical protein